MLNEAICQDHIWTAFEPIVYRFITSIQLPLYERVTSLKTESVSVDGGKSFFITEERKLFGHYFYADKNRNEFSRSVYTISDILSELGGLATSIMAAFGLIGKLINQSFMQIHFVNLLYFDVETHESKEKHRS